MTQRDELRARGAARERTRVHARGRQDAASEQEGHVRKRGGGASQSAQKSAKRPGAGSKAAAQRVGSHERRRASTTDGIVTRVMSGMTGVHARTRHRIPGLWHSCRAERDRFDTPCTCSRRAVVHVGTDLDTGRLAPRQVARDGGPRMLAVRAHERLRPQRGDPPPPPVARLKNAQVPGEWHSPTG